MNNDFNSYFQKITDEWNSKIDSLVNDTIKEVNDDLGNIEREIALIEQGYSAEEVLEMMKNKYK